MATNPPTLRDLQSDISSAPFDWYIEVTPGTTDLGIGARALWCSEDGVLNLTQPDEIARENVLVFKGYNPIACIAINAPTTGSAPAIVWAGR